METVGITSEVLEKLINGQGACMTLDCDSLTVQIVLDIDDFIVSRSLPVKYVLQCVQSLFWEDKCVNEGNFRLKVKKCRDERKRLKKNSRDYKKLMEYMERKFVHGDNQTGSGVGQCGTCPMLEEEIRVLHVRIGQLEKDHENEILRMENELKGCKEKLGMLDERNVSRRIRRRETKIDMLEEELKLKNEVHESVVECMKEQATVLEEKEYECMKEKASGEEVKARMSVLSESYKKMRKSLWYYKKGKSEKEQKMLLGLKERVRGLEDQNTMLHDRLEAFVESEEIVCFENGKYKDDVRSVYHELLGMGVSASKCESIVRSVLSGFGMSVGRLPKETCAKRMVLECRALACMQLSEVLESGENVTVMSDGTTKYGHHYESFDVSMDDGKVYTMGVRDVVSGSSECMLQVFKDILGDMHDLCGAENVSERVKEVVARVKNTMGDRAVTEKKFNVLLAEYRRDVLPDVVDGWKDMSMEEQAECERMNHFFCGMHLLVSLAEQSDATLRVWENLVFGDVAVGATAVCGKSGKSESGTVRLVRTVCKSVQDRGCEKSGKPVYFREFVRTQSGHESVPLAPFKGNRFNILFHNGAGVYFLKSELRGFMNEVKGENLLMKAVNADMNVDQYIAGVRALGLIDKVVTTPLWKVLERKEHMSGMTERYEQMRECFGRWAQDASEFMSGEVQMFDDVEVKKDEVYRRLIEKCELDEMTKQILEMVFASFESKLRVLVQDQLKEGVNAEDNMCLRETESVPRTNVDCERDFGMLDRMMRERPNAHTCVLESMIMYKKNGTNEWIKSLDESRVHDVCEKARKSVDEQRKLFLRRRAVIGAERAARMEKKKSEVERKLQKEHVRAEDLSVDVSRYGGFWKCEKDMETWMNEKDESDARSAVEAQLKFRKFVLKCKNGDGCLNLTSGGKRKEVCELVENLKMSMTESENEKEDVDEVVFAGKCANQEEVNKLKTDYLMDEPKQKRMKSDRKVPFVHDIDDLVGKRVEYLTERGVWKKGTVLRVGGRCEAGYMHVVRFDGEEEEEMSLKGPFKCGALRVIALCARDLIGKNVEQNFRDDITGSESWWRAKVLDVVNARLENPDFVVDYEEEMDEEDGEWRFKLYEDYMNGDLRLCDV